MSDDRTTRPQHVEPNPEKPTDEWVTGDEPMTGPQRSYLETLAREAGQHVPDGLTKAQASDEIERLQRLTGRGDLAERADDPTATREQQLPLDDREDEDPLAENAVIVPDQEAG